MNTGSGEAFSFDECSENKDEAGYAITSQVPAPETATEHPHLTDKSIHQYQ